LPKTFRVLEQNKIWIISASGWLFKKKSITMHGNMNAKFASGCLKQNSFVNTITYLN